MCAPKPQEVQAEIQALTKTVYHGLQAFYAFNEALNAHTCHEDAIWDMPLDKMIQEGAKLFLKG